MIISIMSERLEELVDCETRRSILVDYLKSTDNPSKKTMYMILGYSELSKKEKGNVDENS